MKRIIFIVICLTYFTSLFSRVQLDEIVTLYTFNGNNSSSMKIVDESGNFNHAIVYNGISFIDDRNGISRHAVDIGGSNNNYNFIVINEDSSISSINNMTSMTVIFWYKKTEIPVSLKKNYSSIVSINNSYNEKIDILYTHSTKKIHVASLKNSVILDSISTNTALSDNIWYCISLVINNIDSELQIFVDGVKERVVNFNTSIPVNSKIEIAKGASFSASFDDFSLYDRALSSAEINEVFKNCSVPIPITENIESCFIDKIEASNGSNYKWYLNEAEGSEVSTNNPFYISITESDTFFVTNTVDGCESKRVPLIVKLKKKPLPLIDIVGNDSTKINIVEKYSVENRVGSKFYWSTDGGTGTGFTNEINLSWSVEGTKTINVYEENADLCVGEVLSKKIIVVPETFKNELVAHYSFSGNADDNTKYFNNGIVHDAELVNDRFGNFNSAYYYSGFDCYISANNDPVPPNSSVSFSVWIYPEGDTLSPFSILNNKYILSTGSQTSSTGYCVIWNNGKLLVNRKTETMYANSGYVGSCPPNDWYNVIGIFELQTNELKVYVNGSLISSVESEVLSSENVNNGLFIGAPNNIPWDFNFNGIIDDIKIFNYALSEKSVDSLYKSENKTDVHSIKTNMVYELFPNPITNNSLSIKSNRLLNNTSLIISNNQGQKVKFVNIESNSNSYSLDLSNLPKGLYVLELFSKKERITKKIIID